MATKRSFTLKGYSFLQPQSIYLILKVLIVERLLLSRPYKYLLAYIYLLVAWCYKLSSIGVRARNCTPVKGFPHHSLAVATGITRLCRELLCGVSIQSACASHGTGLIYVKGRSRPFPTTPTSAHEMGCFGLLYPCLKGVCSPWHVIADLHLTIPYSSSKV